MSTPGYNRVCQLLLIFKKQYKFLFLNMHRVVKLKLLTENTSLVSGGKVALYMTSV